MHVSLPIKPIPLGRPRFSRYSGAIYTPPECHRFKRDVARLFKIAQPNHTPYECPLEVEVNFYLKRAKSNKSTQHTKTPDADNLIKAVLDSLNGVAWKDDAQIWSIRGIKFYCMDNSPERIELFIKTTD